MRKVYILRTNVIFTFLNLTFQTHVSILHTWKRCFTGNADKQGNGGKR